MGEPLHEVESQRNERAAEGALRTPPQMKADVRNGLAVRAPAHLPMRQRNAPGSYPFQPAKEESANAAATVRLTSLEKLGMHTVHVYCVIFYLPY